MELLVAQFLEFSVSESLCRGQMQRSDFVKLLFESVTTLKIETHREH